MKRKIYMVSAMLFWGKSNSHCPLFLVVIRILETIQTVSGKGTKFDETSAVPINGIYVTARLICNILETYNRQESIPVGCISPTHQPYVLRPTDFSTEGQWVLK